MAQGGVDWSARLEWHRAEMTGALDLDDTEWSSLECSIGKPESGAYRSAGFEWHRGG